MEDKKTNNEELKESEELGSWTKEMLTPENMVGPFDSIEDLFNSLDEGE